MRVLKRWIYILASLPVRTLLRIFFRRMEASGEENVPPGPVVVAANHPNMLLDPLLVGLMLYPRRICFLAKAPLFQIPVFGWLLHVLGVLPVYRKQDCPDRMGENQSMFRSAVAALHRGDSIGIFPEGVSAADPRLQPLKSGAARILLEAAHAAPEGLNPRLLPAGLNYGDRTLFRSDVLVVFGPPLDPTPYLDRWETDPWGAARAMTEALRESLEGVVRNLDRAEDERVVARLEQVYRTELFPVGASLEERFWLSRNIVDGYEYFRRVEPERVESVERKLEQYFFGLGALDLSGAQLRHGEEGHGLGSVLLFLLRTVPPVVLGLPLALWGMVHNFLPYNLTDPLARRTGSGPEEVATYKVGWGALLFVVFYLLQTALVGWYLGPAVALVYLALLPSTGFVALWWLDHTRYLLRHSRTFWVFTLRRGFRDRMRKLREELLCELAELADRYLAVREGEVEGGAGA